MYQSEPLSATISPYVFIACATIRACRGSVEMSTLAFSRTRRPIGGSVTVSAREASLAVSDTGSGIPAEDVPHAFERFYLYDKIGKDRPVGSGLGLAIVKQLVSAMGGEVGVRSDSRGTTFVVTLGAELRGVDHL